MIAYKSIRDSVNVVCHVEDDELIVDLIETEEKSRGKGLATEVMIDLLAWAYDNKNELCINVVSLFPCPEDDETDADMLRDWYLRWFDDKDGIMEYSL